MEYPAYLPIGSYTAMTYENGSNPENARPGKPGWTPTVPYNNDQLPTDQKPRLLINVTPEGSDTPSVVGKIVVTGYTVKTITYRLILTEQQLTTTSSSGTTSPVLEVTETTPVSNQRTVLEKTITLPNTGVIYVPLTLANFIEIILEEPNLIEEEMPQNYNVTVAVHICREFEGMSHSRTILGYSCFLH